MKMKLSPSVMCCDFIDLKKQLSSFEKKNIELLHIDVMDGHFVPNFTLGTDFVKQLKKATDIPLDLHLMVENPEVYLDSFAFGEGDYVSVHFESTKHLQGVLQKVKDRDANSLLALNPGTPVEFASAVLDDIDGLLVMTVNPGFAGQKMVQSAIQKIVHARTFLDANGKRNAEIEVDGNVSFVNAVQMRNAGANIFVVGTSGIFLGTDIESNIDHFRKTVFEPDTEKTF